MECVCAWNAVVSAITRLTNASPHIDEGFGDLTVEQGATSQVAFYLMLVFVFLFLHTGQRMAQPQKRVADGRNTEDDNEPIY